MKEVHIVESFRLKKKSVRNVVFIEYFDTQDIFFFFNTHLL